MIKLINQPLGLRKKDSQLVGNQIEVAADWSSQCLGYNIQFVLPAPVSAHLNTIQQRILKLEPDSLYLCPKQSLHTTITWILATRRTYNRPKDEIWEAIKENCQSELDKICSNFSSFTITFRDIVATNAAIIILAHDNGEMARLRQAIRASLPIPQETENKAEIIHATLFRYAAALKNPRRLLEFIDGLQEEIPVVVDCLSIRKELIYPSLKSELLHSVKLK